MATPVENVAETQAEAAVQPQEQLAQDSQPQAQPQENIPSDKEINFQKLREKTERLEREKAELETYIKSQVQPAAPKEEGLKIDDDDLVEGKVVKQLYSKINELETYYQRQQQEKINDIPNKLKSKYPDFDEVVTKENVEKLEHSEPELYAAITSGQDLYAKGVSAYKTLKAMGIVQTDHYQEQKQVVADNHSRPMSVQAIKGQSALSDANIFAKGLTPELKTQLQKEMRESIKAR